MKVEVIIENENWDEEKAKKLIEETAESVFSHMNLHHDDIELSVLCTGDQEIQTLNKTYRGVDSPTNVLSFPMDPEYDDLDYDEFDFDEIELANFQKDCGCHGHSSDTECSCEDHCDCSDTTCHCENHSKNDCSCKDPSCNENCCDIDESKKSEEHSENESTWLLGCTAFAYETIEREAQNQGKTFEDHLKHLVVHSVLHLLGYDHIEDEEAEKMEDLEVKILQSIGVSNPYQTEK